MRKKYPPPSKNAINMATAWCYSTTGCKKKPATDHQLEIELSGHVGVNKTVDNRHLLNKDNATVKCEIFLGVEKTSQKCLCAHLG